MVFEMRSAQGLFGDSMLLFRLFDQFACRSRSLGQFGLEKVLRFGELLVRIIQVFGFGKDLPCAAFDGFTLNHLGSREIAGSRFPYGVRRPPSSGLCCS